MSIKFERKDYYYDLYVPGPENYVAEGIVHHNTGVGKTRQQLAVAKMMASQGKKVLLVSTAAILEPKWNRGTISEQSSVYRDGQAMGVPLTLTNGAAPLAEGGVHVTTYEQLGKLRNHIDKDTVVLFDEAHSIKNVGSAQRADYGKEIADKAGGVLYATATPSDQPQHLAYLFRTQLFGDKSWDEVKQEFNPDKHGGVAVLQKIAQTFDRLTEKGLMIRREISLDNLDVQFEHVEVPPEWEQELAELRGGADDATSRANVTLSGRMRLEKHKVPHTVKAAMEELNQGRQVVIFAASVTGGEGQEGTVSLLRQRLAEQGITDVAEHHGTTADKDPVGDFNEGRARVIITTVASGGTGINLDDRSGDRPRTQIVMTAPWSGNENLQIPGRILRLTTKSRAKMRYLFANTDIDNRNRELLSNKMKNLGAVVAGEAHRLDLPDKITEAVEEQPSSEQAADSVANLLYFLLSYLAGELARVDDEGEENQLTESLMEAAWPENYSGVWTYPSGRKQAVKDGKRAKMSELSSGEKQKTAGSKGQEQPKTKGKEPAKGTEPAKPAKQSKDEARKHFQDSIAHVASGKKLSKADLEQLKASAQHLTVSHLKDALKTLEAKVSGKKGELIDRVFDKLGEKVKQSGRKAGIKLDPAKPTAKKEAVETKGKAHNLEVFLSQLAAGDGKLDFEDNRLIRGNEASVEDLAKKLGVSDSPAAGDEDEGEADADPAMSERLKRIDSALTKLKSRVSSEEKGQTEPVEPDPQEATMLNNALMMGRNQNDPRLGNHPKLLDQNKGLHKFTGEDALGRQWVNGKLVAKPEEPKAQEPAKQPEEGKGLPSREELLQLDQKMKSPSTPNEVIDQHREALLNRSVKNAPEVAQVVKGAIGSVSRNRSMTLPELYQQVKQNHPDLSVQDFQSVVANLHNDGTLNLLPHTQAKHSLSDEDLEHLVYGFGRAGKFYVERGKNFAKSDEPSTPANSPIDHLLSILPDSGHLQAAKDNLDTGPNEQWEVDQPGKTAARHLGAALSTMDEADFAKVEPELAKLGWQKQRPKPGWEDVSQQRWAWQDGHATITRDAPAKPAEPAKKAGNSKASNPFSGHPFAGIENDKEKMISRLVKDFGVENKAGYAGWLMSEIPDPWKEHYAKVKIPDQEKHEKALANAVAAVLAKNAFARPTIKDLHQATPVLSVTQLQALLSRMQSEKKISLHPYTQAVKTMSAEDLAYVIPRDQKINFYVDKGDNFSAAPAKPAQQPAAKPDASAAAKPTKMSAKERRKLADTLYTNLGMAGPEDMETRFGAVLDHHGISYDDYLDLARQHPHLPVPPARAQVASGSYPNLGTRAAGAKEVHRELVERLGADHPFTQAAKERAEAYEEAVKTRQAKQQPAQSPTNSSSQTTPSGKSEKPQTGIQAHVGDLPKLMKGEFNNAVADELLTGVQKAYEGLNKNDFQKFAQELGVSVIGTKAHMKKQLDDFINRSAVSHTQTQF